MKELDHSRPPALNLGDREYILRDRVYLFLRGLNPKFEAFMVQIFNRPKKAAIEDGVSAAIHEESILKVSTKHNPPMDQVSNSAFIGQSKEKKNTSYQSCNQRKNPKGNDPKENL